jgi:16S rRNA (cytidine1402-2'-O)-methyltransferase
MPLVLAATPIGDPDDASPRLRRALATADVVAAEDTRRLHRLAAALGVTLTGRVVAVYDAVERSRCAALLAEVREGRTVLLVTDAGMPLISDPGHVLVTEAIAAGLAVTVIPGPSAVTAAVAVAGIGVDRFCVEGFLPRKAGERRTRLSALADDSRALVLFEAPHRLAASLADLATVFGDERRAAVCRELTKTHEEVLRGTLGELAGWAATAQIRGEITVVVAGASSTREPVEDAVLAGEVAERMAAGASRRDSVDAVAAARGLARRVVYAAATARRPMPR